MRKSKHKMFVTKLANNTANITVNKPNAHLPEGESNKLFLPLGDL